jgi:lysyl-tRNA synthetase class 2
VRRNTVVSSAIRSVGFDASTNELEIEFTSGEVYRYAVPARVHRELLAAESPGRYFQAHIRPRYPAWQVWAA